VCHRPSVSLNKEKVSHEIRENKIAVCEKTQGLRSGNFSDLNSACSKVLVPVKIFQFHHMHYESERYRDAANGLLPPPGGYVIIWVCMCVWVSVYVCLSVSTITQEIPFECISPSAKE
jgi:hypothetical protein